MTTNPSWTVLVYMVADTGDSFYRYAMGDITEMMTAQFDDRIRVVVHADGPSPWKTRCWEVTGAPKTTDGSTPAEIGKATEVGCGHTSILDFVQESLRTYHSEKYLLILWGHGEGIDWKQKALAGPASPAIQGIRKRFAPSSQNALEIGELGTALSGLDWRGLKRENVVLGFDACLMGMVEVFDEIQPYVGWVVAAADEIPDTGWPYTDVLQILGNCPDTQPKDLAKNIVDVCAMWYSEHDYHTGEITESDDVPGAKVSFAASDLSNSPAVRHSMTGLTAALRACINDISAWKAVKEARDFAQDLSERAYVDLYAFCSELVRLTDRQARALALTNNKGSINLLLEVKDAASRVMPALNDLIVGFRFSSSYPQKYSQDARAVSICFPESAELVGSIPNLQVNWGSYIDLTFNLTTRWSCFLTEFWDRQRAEGDRRKPKALAAAC
jgi:hypothetical protein